MVLFAVAAAACVAAVTSCKSNRISQRNNGDYDASETVTVDATGAHVIGPDGAEADIPAGALTEPTDITIGKLHGGFPPLPAGWVPAGSVFSFEPHAQQFAKAVDLKVPYRDPGEPVRLAVAGPTVGWTAIDGADFAAGFAHTTTSHFSFYAVVTGAPPDPTLDAGSEGGVDAGPDAEMEAGAPPRPTLFAAAPTRDAVYRFDLTPTSVVDGGVTSAGSNADSGSWSVAGPTCLAPNAGPVYTLFASSHTWALDAGALVLDDAGLPVPTAGAIAPLYDPYGSPFLGAAFQVTRPEVMAFFAGELWVSIGSPPDIETYDGATRTWAGAGAGMTTGTAGYGGIAYDPLAKTVFLSLRGSSAVQRWTVAGSGAAKNAVKSLGDLTTNLTTPAGLAFTPWSELLVVDSSAGVVRFDSSGNAKGTYSPGSLGITPAWSLAAVRWAGGSDELFVFDGASQQIARFAFGDAAHDLPILVGTIPVGANITSLVAVQ